MRRTAFVGLALLAACKGTESKQAPASSTVQTGSAEPTGSGSASPVAARSKSIPSTWAKVLGDKPATFGPTLGSLRFGDPVDVATLPDEPATTWGFFGDPGSGTIRLAPDGPAPKIRIDLEIRSGNLFAIDVELYTSRGSIPEDSCSAFVTELGGMWGPAPERVWADRDRRVRMAFRDTCKLRFEQYVDVATWIGPEATAVVPVALVGKAAKELVPRVDPEISLEDGATFRGAGIGEHATGGTTIDAYTKNGIIVGLGAGVSASAAERAALRAHISSVFKAQPKRDPETGYDVWPSTPPIRMFESKGGVRVEVGNLTP